MSLGMGSSARTLLAITIPVEIVEHRVDANGDVVLLAACQTREDLPPVRGEIRIMGEAATDMSVQAMYELAADALHRDILEGAGLAIAHKLHTVPPPPTIPEIGTGPRIPHEDRARMLAELVTTRAESMQKNCGDDWLRTMLASEFRTVYTDGEHRGYKRRSDEASDDPLQTEPSRPPTKRHASGQVAIARRGLECVTTSGKPPEPGCEELGAPAPIDPSTGQHKAYWVLSPAELEKGYVRPVRRTYRHEKCGQTTTMSETIARTYAAKPSFYGSTFCVTCGGHFPVGADGEFVWAGTTEKVGT